MIRQALEAPRLGAVTQALGVINGVGTPHTTRWASGMQHPAHFDDGRPSFDHAFARELIGKYVLVGITVQNKRGEFKRREQFHGKVVSADESSGIVLSLLGVRAGEFKTLPPMTEVFEPAPRGTYSLKDSDEDVVDPDFLCTWRLTQPDA